MQHLRQHINYCLTEQLSEDTIYYRNIYTNAALTNLQIRVTADITQINITRLDQVSFVLNLYVGVEIFALCYIFMLSIIRRISESKNKKKHTKNPETSLEHHV